VSGEDRPSEAGLIRQFFAPLATAPGAFRLTDDCASHTPEPGEDLVLTKDALAGGVHFFPDDPPASIAKKALRVNLSDLAAKGARPVGYLLALGLPTDWTVEWLAAFTAGLAEDQRTYGLGLLGGDTIRTGERLVVSVTAIGALPSGTMVRRGGARPGDVVFVSGTIGDAALALRRDLPPDAEAAVYFRDRYLHPQPRTGLAELVRTHASGAMDISDGLAGDLEKMAEASGVSIAVNAADVPLSGAARRVVVDMPAALETVLTGGDDYEIACTVLPERADSFLRGAAVAGVAVSRIGTVGKGSGVAFSDGGAPLTFARSAFDHF
jgi:thiamine-monophosphate kinase